MVRPIGGRLSEAFRATYEAAGVTQTQIAQELRSRGWTVEQTHVSRWARGMSQIPLDALPIVEEVCGLPRGTILQRAGYCDPPEKMTVPMAIADDPELDERARVVVLETYEFQKRRSAERSSGRTARIASAT